MVSLTAQKSGTQIIWDLKHIHAEKYREAVRGVVLKHSNAKSLFASQGIASDSSCFCRNSLGVHISSLKCGAGSGHDPAAVAKTMHRTSGITTRTTDAERQFEAGNTQRFLESLLVVQKISRGLICSRTAQSTYESVCPNITLDAQKRSPFRNPLKIVSTSSEPPTPLHRVTDAAVHHCRRLGCVRVVAGSDWL